MAALRVTLPPRSTSVSFYPAISNGRRVLGQASYEEQIQDWQAEIPYLQKVLYTDTLTIEMHCQYDGSAGPSPINHTLEICDKYKTVISAITPLLNAAPYYKGEQVVTGNTYTSNGSVTDLSSQLWAFSIDHFIGGVPDTVYFLKFTNIMAGEPDVVYYSEPLSLSTSHRYTELIQTQYNTNIASKRVVVSDWYDDFPTNTIPHNPIFTLRGELYISNYSPKVINIGYTQQSYEQRQIKTEQVTSWTLKVGENTLGIPYWLLQKLTEALLSDTVYIRNFQYKVFNPNGNPNLFDLWKIRNSGGSEVSPLCYASLPLVWASEDQQALVTPLPDDFRIFTEEFTDVFM